MCQYIYTYICIFFKYTFNFSKFFDFVLSNVVGGLGVCSLIIVVVIWPCNREWFEFCFPRRTFVFSATLFRFFMVLLFSINICTRSWQTFLFVRLLECVLWIFPSGFHSLMFSINIEDHLMQNYICEIRLLWMFRTWWNSWNIQNFELKDSWIIRELTHVNLETVFLTRMDSMF